MAGVSCTSDPLSFTLPVHICALKCSRIFRKRRKIQHTRYKIQKDTNNIQKNCIRCERRVSLGSKKPGPPPRSPFELPNHIHHLFNTFTCTNVSTVTTTWRSCWTNRHKQNEYLKMFDGPIHCGTGLGDAFKHLKKKL